MSQVIRLLFNTRQLRILFFVFLLLPLNILASSNSPEVQDIINNAIKINLWQETKWLNLVHYNRESNKYVSQVDDEKFFYSADGKENPESELIETLKHLFIKTDNHDQQTQCRFIARSEWLIKQLNIDNNSLPVVRCDDYLEWHQMAQADTVTMIFPAYHLNSPSSMFGHTLLRLDRSDNPQPTWLSLAVNFGANIDNSDNSIVYAYQGVVGGYPGIFITEPYFKKIQEYNRIEHRDIWEYKLNLTPEETRAMIHHLWELKNVNFDYYFFDENCSYRLLELLEVARPSIELTDEFVATAIPVDTVRAIEKAHMIESVSYHPAQATEIQFKLAKLSQQERELVMQLSKDFSTAQTDAFTRLSDNEQKKITDLAYKYLRYQNTHKARDPEIAKRSYQLLKKISSYPSDIDLSSDITRPYPPEKGHKSKRLSLALGERLHNKYTEFGYKMSFHDLEDNPSGFLQGAQINLGSIKIRAQDNTGLRLHQFDIVDIFSLTPRNEFFKPLSWKIYTGFERQWTNNKDQLTYHVTGGAGGTWELLKNHQFYALAIARLEANKQLDNTIEPALGFNSGFLSHFKNTTAHLEISGEHFQQGVYRLRTQYTQNIVLATDHSIRFSAKYQWQNDNTGYSDINFAYQYYF